MRVIGLDLSLSSTGVAGIDHNSAWTDRIPTHVDRTPAQLPRLREIRDKVLTFLQFPTDLVMVEGLAISQQTGQHLTRAGLWHLVVEAIDARGLTWVAVSPTAVKKFATGAGNASKAHVMAQILKRVPSLDIRTDDEADAFTLAAMGATFLHCYPYEPFPIAHRIALTKVTWPERFIVDAEVATYTEVGEPRG